MNCNNCRHSQDTGKFCEKCGTKFEETANITSADSVSPTEIPKQPDPIYTEASQATEMLPISSIGTGRNLASFLQFDKMLTPIIIQVIFWIGIGFWGLAGIITIFTELFNISDGGFFLIIIGLFVIIIGPLITRVQCELLIIFFKMHESLQDIRVLMANQAKDSNQA